MKIPCCTDAITDAMYLMSHSASMYTIEKDEILFSPFFQWSLTR